MLLSNETISASTIVTEPDCTGAFQRIASINEDYTDVRTGRTIARCEAKPIEFWFALLAVGWDRTLDQKDEQFLGSRRNQPQQPKLPSDS
jgi:hypothetical protein